ncbi:MAG: tRNA glutamyl-Q(34) synthetase GluQRS [Gammaproteobacteria bacterium]|nr:tRNA glutamyl-Q(34) synthetase GluQRS [Gammaproteobacteria bacterium]
MVTSADRPYIGRFAPSPTGPLHFGSLLAAIASYLQSRTANGRWLLRIEDIDPPREQPGADKLILDTLESYGFEWDGPVTYQSHFRERHEASIEKLIATGLAYPCSCSRRDLATAVRGPLGAIYPGTCRQGCESSDVAIRVRTHGNPITFTDRLQGRRTMQLESASGDFVIRRRDGLVAYHLAVVNDDADQGITEVVRGIDLLDSTPRHIHLQELLDIPTPSYVHIPVAENAAGQKLSKLTGAPAISIDRASRTLVAALRALGQTTPQELEAESLDEIWAWATQHWQINRLSARQNIAPQHYC